ncbi:hypothetical protein [Okeania sp. SIO2B3]|nr:hypothetical protein [Okeania sp. SIO2B3]
MGRWEPTPDPSQEGNLGRWGDGEMISHSRELDIKTISNPHTKPL